MFFVFCGLGMAYTFRVSASKCGHQNAQRQIATFVTGETLADVSKKVHPDEADELESLGFIGQEETVSLYQIPCLPGDEVPCFLHKKFLCKKAPSIHIFTRIAKDGAKCGSSKAHRRI